MNPPAAGVLSTSSPRSLAERNNWEAVGYIIRCGGFDPVAITPDSPSIY